MAQKNSTRIAWFTRFGAVVIVLLALGQAGLSRSLRDGWRGGPTPEWVVFGPLGAWVLLCGACAVWAAFAVAGKAGGRRWAVLAAVGAACGLAFASIAATEFLRIV